MTPRRPLPPDHAITPQEPPASPDLPHRTPSLVEWGPASGTSLWRYLRASHRPPWPTPYPARLLPLLGRVPRAHAATPRRGLRRGSGAAVPPAVPPRVPVRCPPLPSRKALHTVRCWHALEKHRPTSWDALVSDTTPSHMGQSRLPGQCPLGFASRALGAQRLGVRYTLRWASSLHCGAEAKAPFHQGRGA